MMDEHRAAYREEARELLSDLERALLELEQNPAEDLVSQVFRSMHTIKGSGAMFGFDDIAGFTHHVENAFDLVRQGKLEVTGSLINLTLAARDHISALLDAAMGGGSVDRAAGDRILEGFGGLAPSGVPKAPPTAPGPALPESTFRIRFRPPSGVLLTGANPLLLIRELRSLGSCTVLAHTEEYPPLEEFDFEQCYTWWDIVLTTSQGEDAIHDVFIFVESDSELIISPENPMPVAAEPKIAAPQEQQHPASKSNAELSSSIRVPAERLDSLVNVVGELVTVQARLSQFAASCGDPEAAFIAEELERLTGRLRDNTMSIRMLPIGATFGRFRRLVRDLARDLHKEIDFVTEGGETELDKTVIEQLNDPLVHLIRNSIDHGVESAQVRVQSGKPAKGTIRLSAVHSGAHVLIRIDDDGAGLDADAIRARAIEKGLIAPDAELSQAETFALILEPGFSTARVITEVSGRGVGMDVVHRSIEALRGSLDIASHKGQGTSITLKLPLTLAIIDGLLVTIGSNYFVLPLASTLECFEISRHQLNSGQGGRFAAVRGELVPYIDLRQYLSISESEPPCSQVMVAETRQGKFGFVVDRIIGDHQTVIKRLGGLYKNLDTFSGATILGDGTVALILDLDKLAQHCVDETLASTLRPLP